MVLRFEHFLQSDYIRMPNFFEYVDFLHYFLFGKGIFHIAFIDGFDGNIATREFMDAEGHFAKSTFADFLDEFVEFEWSGR